MENLLITESMKTKLLSTTKWLTFINIMSVVALVYMLFGGIFCIGYGILFILFPNILMQSEAFANAPTDLLVPMGGVYTVIGVFYIVMTGFYVIPVLQSFKFVRNLRSAFSDNSQMLLEVANDCYCKCIKFIGIGIIAGVIATILISLAAAAVVVFVICNSLN